MNLETPDDDDQESPRIRAVFDRLSARVDPPVEDDWESAINNLSERPADHGQPTVPRYRVHPAANIFPMLDEDALADLAEDIAMHGLREPVYLFRDPQMGEVLLDGRNRLAACEMLGIEPATRFFEGPDPLEFVLSQNLHRRHLSAGQRAAIAEQMKPLFEREAKERKRQAGGDRKSLTAKMRQAIPSGGDQANNESTEADRHERTAAGRAAKAVHVSPRAVDQFSRVKKADPDLAQKVAAGEVSLGRAEREVRERAQQHGGGKATPERPPAPAGELLGADLSSVTSIACAPPDWPHRLPWLDVEGCRVVVDRAVFAGLLAGIEQELTAVASTKPAATATPPASQCTAEDYRRTTEGY